MDWLPTFIELCGLRKPPLQGLPFDGVSLAPLLTGKEDSADPKWAERMYVLQSSKGRVVMKQHWRLINNTLTNLKEDPQQQANVADKHPALAAAMDKFDRDFRVTLAETAWRSNRPIYVGETPNERLSFRMASFYLQGHILAGKRHNATWPVHFLHAGTYELEFRRWAPEVNQPLDVAITVKPNESVHLAGRPVYVNGGGSRGKALPIRSVKLDIGGKVYQVAAEPNQSAIIMRVTEEEGPAIMKATFLDNNGKAITTPYYAYIRRILEQ